MEFGDALELLRNSVNPPLPLVVLWRDLMNNAFVDKGTTIGLEVDGAMPVGKALWLLLKSVGGELGEIRYLVDGGVVTIATQEMKLQRKVVRIYDVSELTARRAGNMGNYGNRPGNYGNGQGQGNYMSSNNLYGNIIGNISGNRNNFGNGNWYNNRNSYNNNSFNKYSRPGGS